MGLLHPLSIHLSAEIVNFHLSAGINTDTVNLGIHSLLDFLSLVSVPGYTTPEAEHLQHVTIWVLLF